MSAAGRLLDLTLLAPDIQEELLCLEAVDGLEPVTERGLRNVVATTDWAEQRRRWAAVVRRTACYRSGAGRAAGAARRQIT